LSKLVFTNVGTVGKPYRGVISRVRTLLREVATFVQDSPGSKAAVQASTAVLVNSLGTSTVLMNGKALTGVTPTGTFVTTVTFTVAGGAITAIALS
jgi:hypothetical protein